MNEENNQPIPETPDNINELGKTNTTENEIAAQESINTSASDNNTAKVLPDNQQDISKVKIRSILKQRYKKSGRFLKVVLPLVLVGIICFTAGIIAGRSIDRHERVYMSKPGMYSQMPRGNFNGGNFSRKQFNNRGNQVPNNKTPQATPPAAAN